MRRRREFLAVAGAAAGAGLGGCFGLFGTESGEQTTLGDGLVGTVANPSEQVPAKFLAGYQFQLPDIPDSVSLSAITPGLGGNFVPIVRDQISGVSLSDIETFTGSRVRSQGIAGGGLAFSAPSGQSLVVEGEFESGPFGDWLSANNVDSLGEQSGYQRYGTSAENGSFEAFAVADGEFIAVARSDVNFGPEAAIDLEIAHRNGEQSSVASSAPAFAGVAEELDDAPIQRATGYALIPLGADTGTQALDDVVRGVVGSGLSVSPGDEVEIQRAVGYLDAGMASESAVIDAFGATEIEELDTEWTTSVSGSVVSARASVGSMPSPAMLQTALPMAGYENLWNPIDPTKLGRDSPPVVYFQPSVDEETGTLKIEHIGGSQVEDLLVRYVSDGTEQRERWSGPVSEGSQFESETAIDSGTQAWVVWKPETTDAAVVSRFRRPS